MRQPEKMIVYNLFPLLAGKFTEWEGHLKRASEMGFNWIFVNPVQLPGLSGSLYSIKDYFSFNPLLIDTASEKTPEEQIRDTIRTAEGLGQRMMIDLVINHCAVDSGLIREHPEWFQWEKKGKVANPFCDENGKKVVWGDLAKFDHRHTRDKEGLFRFFFKVVKFLIDLGFKGFRCDAAYQIPKGFWKRLITETKAAYPDVLFFAETLGCTADQTRKTAGAGFDYIFNSSKWWDLSSPWLIEQYALTREIAPSISFPESHDTVRLCEEFNGNIAGLRQRYLFSALFSAGVMMPAGFEFGFRKKPHVVKTRPEDWEETDIDLTSFIKSVNKIKESYTIFQEEAPTEILPAGNPDILIMWKASVHTQEEALLILNKDINNKQRFYADSLRKLAQAGAPLNDVSPEYRLDHIPEPFSYDLRPGQGIVLVTARDTVVNDF
ncbi:alpha-1,4-glucan:maltose-1-phosphate maltosyltransferase [bacterium BMS3Abin06]|nr:alpha-1,4-glucan:maltose-1-phosphate maltosyltransferase [bacterium BMS3Abin06]